MAGDLMATKLGRRQFEQIGRVVHRITGIKLPDGKQALVKGRLVKRLRALGIDSFDEYLAYVESDASGRELASMIDALTTNKTSFFREPQHFDFLRDHVLPGLTGGRMRFWSAGCSSGEEPYTLAMLLRQRVPNVDRRDVRILATDISPAELAKARARRYSEDTVQDVPPMMRGRYLVCVQAKKPREYQVTDEVAGLVRFAELNLMAPWPMKGPFDAILCRNVMIYFDKPTQQQLVQRFWDLLKPGGHMFVGHSESLTRTTADFRYVQPAVYVK